MKLWETRGMVVRGAATEPRIPTKWLVLPAAIIAALVAVVLWPGVFVITDVQFTGRGAIPPDSFLRIRQGLVGKNLITVNVAEARARLLEIPEVRDVVFARRLRHTLECRLVRREPVALLVAGDILEVDESGVVIPRRSGRGDIDLPVITGIDQGALRAKTGARQIRRAVGVLELFKELGFSPAKELSEIHVSEEDVDLVWMGTGTLVRLGREAYADKVRKLRTVAGILNDRERYPEVIDLRFDRQVVVR